MQAAGSAITLVSVPQHLQAAKEMKQETKEAKRDKLAALEMVDEERDKFRLFQMEQAASASVAKPALQRTVQGIRDETAGNPTLQLDVQRKQREIERLRGSLTDQALSLKRSRAEVAHFKEQVEKLEAASGSGGGNQADTVRAVSTMQWENDKRHKKVVDGLRAKIVEQAASLSKSTDQLEHYRELLQRLTKDNTSLKTKLAGPGATFGGQSELFQARGWEQAKDHAAQLERLKRELLQQQNQCRAAEMVRDQFAAQLEAARAGTGPGIKERDALVAKADSESAVRLASENDNVLLRFENEQSKAKLERSEARVAALEAERSKKKATASALPTPVDQPSNGVSNTKYMEVVKANKRLKHELATAKGTESQLSASASAGSDSKTIERLSAEHDKAVATNKKYRAQLEQTQKQLVSARAARAPPGTPHTLASISRDTHARVHRGSPLDAERSSLCNHLLTGPCVCCDRRWLSAGARYLLLRKRTVKQALAARTNGLSSSSQRRVRAQKRSQRGTVSCSSSWRNFELALRENYHGQTSLKSYGNTTQSCRQR